MIKVDVDLHIHSSCSDGSDSIDELLEAIKREGIRIFSLTDHDTVKGIREMEKIVPEEIRFIPGVEFSCITDVGKCHILGYGFDLDDPVFQTVIQEASSLRYDKLSQRLTYLRETFQITFNQSELDWLHSQNSAGRPHIAELMIRRGIVSSRDEAFEKYLGQMPSPRMDAGKVIHAIRSAGGIAVWAHPFGEKSSEFLLENEVLKLLDRLIKLGIQGIECYYSQYDDEKNQYLVGLAQENNLWISGGSDYHGERKIISLGTLEETTNQFFPKSKLTILKALGK